MRGLLIGLSFLTILPFRIEDLSEAEVGGSTLAFPIVGLVKGLLIYAPVYFLKDYLRPDILSILTLAFYIILTGALHLDGLSDTFDGMALRGSRDKKLSVMKDSTVGPVGVVALVVLLLAKFVFFKEIIEDRNLLGLLLFPVAGAMAMVTGAYFFSPARREGLGSLFIRNTGKKEFGWAVFWTILITGLCGTLWQMPSRAFISMFLALTSSFLFGRYIEVHFGGHTGDSLGAMAEVSESCLLFFWLVCPW